MYSSYAVWGTESENKAKETLARVFNKVDGFKVTYDDKTHKITAEKNGASFEVRLDSVGYSHKTLDINVNESWSYDNYKTIGRITPKTDLYAPRFQREFKDYANRRADEILTTRITQPALEKSRQKSAKTFEQWEKDNMKLIAHKTVDEVKVEEEGYRHMNASKIGTDSIVTELSAYNTITYPNTTQLFNVIVQSGIKVHDVGNNHVKVVGNAEETTAFLELLNNPLGWN